MTNNDKDKKQKSGQLVLDLELQDVLDIVSKAGNRSSISEELSDHVIEGESLKKAWFKHVLLTLEKLNDTVETTRTVDIPQLRKELQNDIVGVRAELKGDINKVERKIERNEEDLKQYKKETRDIIDPMNKSLITLSVKIGLFALVFSFFGSGLMALIVYLIRDYLLGAGG